MKKPKEKSNFFERTGATKGAPVILPGGAGGRSKKFTSKHNFEKIKKKLEVTGRLDLQDFGNTQDIGLFIDWYNKGVEDKREARATREIVSISKFLARILGRKTIYLK